MSDSRPTAQTRFLAIDVRDRFVKEVDAVLPSFVTVAQRAMDGVDAKDPRYAMLVHDAASALDKHSERWVSGMSQAWQAALSAGETRMGGMAAMLPSTLELVGDEEVETRIIASRLSLGVSDMAAQELSDLRVRVRHLEGTQDLDA